MTEDEWFAKGDSRLKEWEANLKPFASWLTDPEESAFLYAWELAGRELGFIK